MINNDNDIMTLTLGGTYFQMNGFTQMLIAIERQKAIHKYPIIWLN